VLCYSLSAPFFRGRAGFHSRRSPTGENAATRFPGIIRRPHENTAAHMAAGYAFVTDRTANTATAMHSDRPGRRRRQLLFQQPVLGVRRIAATWSSDPHYRVRQFRLVGGQGIDVASVPRREAGAQNEFEAEVEYGKVGEAFGAEKLGDLDDVPAAIARCMRHTSLRRGGWSSISRGSARVVPLPF